MDDIIVLWVRVMREFEVETHLVYFSALCKERDRRIFNHLELTKLALKNLLRVLVPMN